MKKILSLVAAALCLALILCACGEEDRSDGLQLYFPCSGEADELIPDAVGCEDYRGDEDPDALIKALLAGPSESGMSRLFGEDVRLTGWALVSGVLHLDLSREFRNLDAVDQTLAECCMTLTFTQLEGVDKVRITVDGRNVADRAHRVLEVNDMIFTGAEEEPRQVSVELYFPRSGGRGLGFEEREITVPEDGDLYTAVTLALLKGPESSALNALFPEGTEVLDVRLEGGICYVNFSAELVENAPPDSAEQDLLLYTIVDTLGNLDEVSAVQVLVEGEVPKNYGNSDTSFPMEPDFGLLTRE